MSASMYKFTDSASDNAKKDFIRIKIAIGEALESIDNSVESLKSQWDASEAETYFEIIKNWKEGAAGLQSVLGNIRDTLDGIQKGNTELRSGISQILDETQ